MMHELECMVLRTFLHLCNWPIGPIPWHPWFAWRPVKLDGRWCWPLEEIERRRVRHIGYYGHLTWREWWEYRRLP